MSAASVRTSGRRDNLPVFPIEAGNKGDCGSFSKRFPMLPPEWILRPTEWDPGARERFAQGRARYAFCPLCLQEMIFRARTVWIRSEWAFVFQTHCPTHRAQIHSGVVTFSGGNVRRRKSR